MKEIDRYIEKLDATIEELVTNMQPEMPLQMCLSMTNTRKPLGKKFYLM